MKSGVFSFCKGIDSFCPLGPHIVTADEIKDPHNLAMELRVNGESRQRSHSSKMSVTIPEILAHYSAMGYSAGDVVSTGTVSGVAAFSADPKAWFLKPGDVMECEIEQIGVLRNPVISWEEAYGEKPPAWPRKRKRPRDESELAGKVWTSELNSRPDVRPNFDRSRTIRFYDTTLARRRADGRRHLQPAAEAGDREEAGRAWRRTHRGRIPQGVGRRMARPFR